jgi:hypothetical protein
MESSKPIKIDVFGRQVLAIRTGNGWRLYYVSGDGKRRVAADLIVPPFVEEMEIERYLADMCHEWATADHPEVIRLD